MTFAETVQTWQTYYLLIGGAAATLAGLLFIGLSLNLEVLRNGESIRVQGWTTQTFANFIHLLLISVFFLIPNQTPNGLGIPLLFLGLLGVYDIINLLWRIYRKQHHVGASKIISHFVLPLIAFIVLTVCAILLLNQQMEALAWLVAVVVLLFFSSTRNVWDLMVNLRVGEQQT